MAGDELVPRPGPESAKDRRIFELEYELAGWKLKHEQLHKTYLQLVDQWSAFQMQFRNNVTPRQANRAEAAGELSRLLANALLCVAYDKDGIDLLTQVMERLRAQQDPASGREVVTHRVETGLVRR